MTNMTNTVTNAPVHATSGPLDPEDNTPTFFGALQDVPKLWFLRRTFTDPWEPLAGVGEMSGGAIVQMRPPPVDTPVTITVSYGWAAKVVDDDNINAGDEDDDDAVIAALKAALS